MKNSIDFTLLKPNRLNYNLVAHKTILNSRNNINTSKSGQMKTSLLNRKLEQSYPLKKTFV